VKTFFGVAGHTIGGGPRRFVIAEMSGNHNGRLGRALAIVERAHRRSRSRRTGPVR
jgi:sialic acid synthase SpsE